MFIDTSYIENLLEAAKQSPAAGVEKIIEKAAKLEGLSREEVAKLLTCEDEGQIALLFETAEKIKDRIYGARVVMFAPLYVSDYCVNKCAYCNFNSDHKFKRTRLTQDQIRAEVSALEKMGHKRIALEAGEDSSECPIDYITECIATIYNVKTKKGDQSIRRVNVNIAAATVEDYKKLKNAGVGTYILFQETYHRPTYEKIHISGPKKDFEYHLNAFDRAMEAGLDDVGGGALFGLYDPYFEVLALMIHNEHLEKKFGVGFHTVSIPRLCKADGAIVSEYPHAVSDSDFLKIAAVLRLAIPFTGIIVSTRESAELRKKLIHIGVSQTSGGSAATVGGYSGEGVQGGGVSQFEKSDTRKTSDIASWLIEENLVPSFCTACYRSQRTGDRFMRLAKSGDIKNVCAPNALMTLWEYATDYGTDEFAAKARALIDKEIAKIESEKIRALTAANIEKITNGKRDLFI